MVASIKVIYDIQYIIYDMYVYALLGELVWYGVECEQR